MASRSSPQKRNVRIPNFPLVAGITFILIVVLSGWEAVYTVRDFVTLITILGGTFGLGVWAGRCWNGVEVKIE